jgi:archaemetzincin
MRIILRPLIATLEYNTLRLLGLDIAKEFKNVKVKVDYSPYQLYPNAEIQSAFDRFRNQWNSDKLLQALSKKGNRDLETKSLFICDADAYSAGLDFVFGQAVNTGPLAIVYLLRIRQEFYGFPLNQQLFYARLVKESVHELGHAFGLKHCGSPVCVMYFSNSLQDTDTKERRFCENCRNKLLRAYP